MTVAVTRRELSAAELRRAAVRCRGAAARRMLALALVLEGSSREAAVRAAGMDRQRLRDGVHRYNAQGLAGLHDRPRPGRKPRLTPEQMAERDKVVEQGPDPARDGVVRWRRVDLQARLKARFEVALHERAVGKRLRRLGFARLSVRPQHPSSDPEAQEAFKKGSRRWCRRRCPSPRKAGRSRSGSRTVECDAFYRVGQQGTLTRVWARRGSRPRAPRDRRYAWAYLFGAVCPERAVGAGLVLPFANTEAMTLHPGLARLRGDRRDLLPSLERADGHARTARLDHPPRVGQTARQLGV